MDIGSALHVRTKLYWDAKKLLNTIKSLRDCAGDHTARTGSNGRKPLTLTDCKKLIARQYYKSSKDAFQDLDNLEKFATNNYVAGVWSDQFDRHWREAPYLKQVAAIKEAKNSGRPLKECADKEGVNFNGFHFSSILYMELFPIETCTDVLQQLHLIDFTGISANGIYIESIWLSVISSFAKASLKHGKFYTKNPEYCRPGTNAYRMDFSGADLSYADLRFSYLRGCNFSDAILDSTDLRDANIFQCVFKGATGQYKLTATHNKGAIYLRYLTNFHGYPPVKK